MLATKVTEEQSERIKAGDIKVLNMVLSAEAKVTQEIVNNTKEDFRYPQGRLAVLHSLLDILS